MEWAIERDWISSEWIYIAYILLLIQTICRLPPMSPAVYITLHFMNSQYQMGDRIYRLVSMVQLNFTFASRNYTMESTFSPLGVYQPTKPAYMIRGTRCRPTIGVCMHFWQKCRIHYRLCCHILSVTALMHSCIHIFHASRCTLCSTLYIRLLNNLMWHFAFARLVFVLVLMLLTLLPSSSLSPSPPPPAPPPPPLPPPHIWLQRRKNPKLFSISRCAYCTHNVTAVNFIKAQQMYKCIHAYQMEWRRLHEDWGAKRQQ